MHTCAICGEPVTVRTTLCDDCLTLDESAVEDELNQLLFVQDWDESIFDQTQRKSLYV
jgi:hypothetical protein